MHYKISFPPFCAFLHSWGWLCNMHEEIGDAIGSRVQTLMGDLSLGSGRGQDERDDWENLSIGVGRRYRTFESGKALKSVKKYLWGVKNWC